MQIKIKELRWKNLKNGDNLKLVDIYIKYNKPIT